ncbi:hypothetical protein [endosymbiont GvMRE of Glomus versiforme]|uniref:hypothetical protein n=1 Tax=endosymbiont GvMRE of Glomus versiforme TaxID=2039283 RepID=UPI000EE11469|nr:hypothetical protein [endosymbiont GvMRE of Glomus versiforme]RHZ35308.1 Serine/threonine protein kinase [endosymbiont GvMRE of Glomus versiforme]
MVTPQKYLDNKYKTKAEREKVKTINVDELLESGELDLSDYVDAEAIFLPRSNLTKLNLGEMQNLKLIFLYDNNLTSIDFLNILPCPEKLKSLVVSNNKIQPTDIAIFSRFKNLKTLKIGTSKDGLAGERRNYFYGSLESWKDLSKLESICIEATDIDRGLEYLPSSLAKATVKSELEIECAPNRSDAKCKAIQDQLRPFDYDLEAWQLCHSRKIIKVCNEKMPKSETQLITLLLTKIRETQTEITQLNKKKKITRGKRLENRLKLLQKAYDELETELEQKKMLYYETNKVEHYLKLLKKSNIFSILLLFLIIVIILIFSVISLKKYSIRNLFTYYK